MMTISAMSNGSQDYFLDLARQKYYLEGGEPPGKWYGTGATVLGLEGTVKADQLNNIFEGYKPNGEPLVQNAGSKKRQPGWDLTFSAPKSVSILWGLSEAKNRREIQQAHALAVQAAINYLEDEFGFRDLGSGLFGSETDSFEHGQQFIEVRDDRLCHHDGVAADNDAVR